MSAGAATVTKPFPTAREEVIAVDEREKQLALAVTQIEKQYGKGAVMRLGDHRQRLTVESIPTGSIALDIALGIGGFPRGRVVELFGPEGSGKTTVALHVIAEAQKKGGVAAFIDAEHALDPNYAKNLGVDIDALLVSQPDTGEQALEIADMLIRSGAIDVLTVDSVAALVPRAEIEGEMGDSHMGLQARLMSQALRKLTGSVAKSKTCVIFINQIREKIGVMFGSPETTPGGRALKFYSSVRLDVRRIEGIKDGAEFIGNRVRAKVVKNKCIAEGTRVFDPTTGLTHQIEEIVDSGAGAAVYAADKCGKLHVRPIVSRFDQGEQNVIGVSFRSGATLWATPDHKILTDKGWLEAGELQKGDYVARPRKTGGFGSEQPVSPDHARLIGYLIGDGYVGGKTPIAFINTQSDLRDDAARMAKELGCRVDVKKGGIYMTFSHRPGEKNGVLELARWAGIWGGLAPDKKIPIPFFSPDCSEDVVANLLFGIWESDGWISREQSGAIRCGFVTTSEQLAHQIGWLLRRWGIGTSASVHQPGSRHSVINGRRIAGKLPCWQVRVSGIDNVTRFAEVIPMWGPRGRVLVRELDNPELRKHRGSRLGYLPPSATAPVLAYLNEIGLTAREAAAMVGYRSETQRAGLRVVLGPSRLRRDRVEALAEALDSEFLRGILDEDVYYERIWEILPARRARTFDIEVEDLHTFVADGVVVHNCAPPFRTAEFDLMYSKGISMEGSLLDVAVEQGIIHKSGAWYTYNEEQIGQGRENAKAFLVENPEMTGEIESLVRAQLAADQAPSNGELPPPPEAEEDEAPPLKAVVEEMTAKIGPKKK